MSVVPGSNANAATPRLVAAGERDHQDRDNPAFHGAWAHEAPVCHTAHVQHTGADDTSTLLAFVVRMIELGGAILIVIDLFTRVSACLCSGEAAAINGVVALRMPARPPWNGFVAKSGRDMRRSTTPACEPASPRRQLPRRRNSRPADRPETIS